MPSSRARAVLAAPLMAAALLAGCVETTVSGAPGAPAIPAGAPVPGSQIAALVAGGPYDVTIYEGPSAGTRARISWNFDTATVFGDFTTAAGETESFMRTISIEGDLLCTALGAAAPECKAVYPYRNGFMEVTPSGAVHAVSLPI